MPTLRINLVLHSSKYSYIIQVHIKHMNRLSLVWSPLTSSHSILYYGHCNMQHWRFSSDWSGMCASWSLSYSTSFQSDLLPHLQSLYSIHASACSWVPLGGTWENKALAWVGYKFWRCDNKLPCGVYYSKCLDFLPVWGEHWLCTGEDVPGVQT